MKKSPLKSKTLWTNFVMAATALFVPQANDWISANPMAFTVAFSVVNMILRFVTKDPLKVIE